MSKIFQTASMIVLSLLLVTPLFASGRGVASLSVKEKEDRLLSENEAKMKTHFSSAELPVYDFLSLSFSSEDFEKKFKDGLDQILLGELLSAPHQKLLKETLPWSEKALLAAEKSHQKGRVLFLETRQRNFLDSRLGASSYEFLTYSIQKYRAYFGENSIQEQSTLRAILTPSKRKFLESFISTDGQALQSAIDAGKPGLALCIREFHRNRKEKDAYDTHTISCFQRYCHKNGFDAFVDYVTTTNLFGFSKEKLGLSLSYALLGELQKKASSPVLKKFFSEKDFRLQKPLFFNAVLSDALYIEASKRCHEPLMNFLLTHPETSKPTQALENHVLDRSLKSDSVSTHFGKWLLTSKPGLKGDIRLLEARIFEDIKKKYWENARDWIREFRPILNPQALAVPEGSDSPEESIHTLFSERAPENLPEHLQVFIDQAYVFAAAHGNQKFMDDVSLLLGYPSLQGEDDAFVNAAANGWVDILKDQYRHQKTPSQTALNTALPHTITYYHSNTFDWILDNLNATFPNAVLAECLQIKPRQTGGLFSMIFLNEENHFQKRLREKFFPSLYPSQISERLGIPPYAEFPISILLNSTIRSLFDPASYTTQFESLLKTPEYTLIPLQPLLTFLESSVRAFSLNLPNLTLDLSMLTLDPDLDSFYLTRCLASIPVPQHHSRPQLALLSSTEKSPDSTS